MKSNRGFSLLETLLYLGIFAIVGGSLFGILTNVVRISTKEVAGDEVSSQLNFTMTTLNRLVREASNIETSTSTATTTLKLRMADPLKDPTCVILSGGVLKLAEGPDPFQKQNCTSTTTDITTDKVVVDKALFRKAEFPGGHDQILLDLQFSNLASGASKISRVLRSGISRVSAATFDSDLLPNTDAQYEVGFSGTKRWKNISISNLLNLGTITSDPAGIDGSIYYNSTSKAFRGKANGVWADLGSTLWRATSTNMYSNVTGNVGIGTNNPAASLDVGGFGANGALRNVFARQSEGNATGDGTFLGVRAWGTQTASYGGKMFSIENTFYGSLNSSIEFYRGSSQTGGFMTFTTDNGTERMRINPNGNIGIGTINPVAKLSLAGGSANWNETTPGLTVGSMHLDPESATDHFGSAITFGASDAGNGESAQAGIYTRSDGSYGVKMYFATTDAYASGSKTRIMINNNGNVGIGTTSPTQKLDVNGGITGTTLIAGTGGVTLGGVNRTTWPAGAVTPQVFSKMECMSANNCLIAGIDKVYAFYGPGNTTYSLDAAGVTPESSISCISANVCIIAGTDKSYAYFASSNAVYLQSTPGTTPKSKTVVINTNNALIPGTDKTYAYYISSNAVYLQSTPGTFPESTIACASTNICVIVGVDNSYSYYVSSNAVYLQSTPGSK